MTIQETAPKPTDTQRRDEMMIQAVRGLFIMNGGGGVALLAFLQAVWTHSNIAVGPVLFGLIWLGLGTALAGSVLLVRYSTTVAFAQHSRWRWCWHHAYMICAWGSVVCFSGGVLTVSIGLLLRLPGVP